MILEVVPLMSKLLQVCGTGMVSIALQRGLAMMISWLCFCMCDAEGHHCFH